MFEGKTYYTDLKEKIV